MRRGGGFSRKMGSDKEVVALAMCSIQACVLRGWLMMSYLEGIPLLYYADDTIFFMEGSVEEVRNLSTLP